MSNDRDPDADLIEVNEKCQECDGTGKIDYPGVWTACHCETCSGTGRTHDIGVRIIAEYWIGETKRLQAENADLKSREVIEHGSIHYAPLAATNGTWEWLDASDGLQMYLGRDTLPHDLYALLPGVNLDKFAMAYPTRDAAMDALRASIAATRGGA